MKKLCLLLAVLMAGFSMFAFADTKIELYKDMVVSENLRLRNARLDGRKVITVLNAGSIVKVIGIDNEETIDGIASNWVKVEVQRNAVDRDGNPIKYGVIGYCFAGYLKETKQEKYVPNYANGNGTILSESEDLGEKLVIRRHVQKVKIGQFASQDERILYSDTNKTSIAYRMKDGDYMDVSEVWTITTKKDGYHYVWFKASVNGTEGFYCWSEPYYSDYYKKTIDSYNDPYKNNKMEIMETIKSGGSKWTVRKITQSLSVFSSENTIDLWDVPGKKGAKVIDKVPASYKNGNGQTNFAIEAITEENDSENKYDRWVRITYNGKTGWVQGHYLSAERGGPKYYIPEDSIQFALGDAP